MTLFLCGHFKEKQPFLKVCVYKNFNDKSVSIYIHECKCICSLLLTTFQNKCHFNILYVSLGEI